MFRKAALVVVGALLFVAPAATAQNNEAWLELVRQDIKTQKVAILTAVLDMNDETASAFWPVYREYDNEDAKIGDQRVALIKQYAEVYTNLDDMKAKQLAADWFKLQDAKLDLKKKYFKKIEKATNTSLAARFMQAQSQIDMLIDIQIAGNLPLLQKGMEEMKAAPASSSEN